jgi:hypothetical protein
MADKPTKTLSDSDIETLQRRAGPQTNTPGTDTDAHAATDADAHVATDADAAPAPAPKASSDADS